MPYGEMWAWTSTPSGVGARGQQGWLCAAPSKGCCWQASRKFEEWDHRSADKTRPARAARGVRFRAESHDTRQRAEGISECSLSPRACGLGSGDSCSPYAGKNARGLCGRDEPSEFTDYLQL